MSTEDMDPAQNGHLATKTPRLLSQIAYERIKEAIRNSDIEPGQPLSEKKLSSLLGISRTPVRVAIQQLAQEGLIQIIPGRAITVASLSVEEVMNAIHVRAIIEPEVARLAATSISPESLEILFSAMQQMKAAIHDEDRSIWVEADRKFHEILSATCPNKLLGKMVLEVRNRISYLSISNPIDPKRMDVCTEEHCRVVDAIAARNPLAAEQSMRDHLEKLQESFFRRLTHI